MWSLLSRFRPKFTRQLPIGPYIVDFACRQAKLVVEVDGGQHAESERDVVRDQWLGDNGGSHRCSRRRVPRRHPPRAPPFLGGEEASRLKAGMDPSTIHSSVNGPPPRASSGRSWSGRRDIALTGAAVLP